MVADYFDNFDWIDVHDHYQQGMLKLEMAWHTHKWHRRLERTLFGVVVTDAYFLHCELLGRQSNFLEFVDKMCHQLINPSSDGSDTTPARSSRRQSVSPQPDLASTASNVNEIPVQLSTKDLPEVKRKKKLRLDAAQNQLQMSAAWSYQGKKGQCRICRKRTTMYCSSASHSALFYACSPATGRPCWPQHLAEHVTSVQKEA
jgi:hypothetical protein